MTDELPRQGRRLRRYELWGLALILLFAVNYVAASGLASYAVGRGWVSTRSSYMPLFRPLLFAAHSTGQVNTLASYTKWCSELGFKHAGKPRIEDRW